MGPVARAATIVNTSVSEVPDFSESTSARADHSTMTPTQQSTYPLVYLQAWQ